MDRYAEQLVCQARARLLARTHHRHGDTVRAFCINFGEFSTIHRLEDECNNSWKRVSQGGKE